MLGPHLVIGMLGPHLVIGMLGPHLVIGRLGPHLVIGMLGPYLVIGRLGPHLIIGRLGPHLVIGRLGPHLVIGRLGPHLVIGRLGPQVIGSFPKQVIGRRGLHHLPPTHPPPTDTSHLALLCAAIRPCAWSGVTRWLRELAPTRQQQGPGPRGSCVSCESPGFRM